MLLRMVYYQLDRSILVVHTELFSLLVGSNFKKILLFMVIYRAELLFFMSPGFMINFYDVR